MFFYFFYICLWFDSNPLTTTATLVLFLFLYLTRLHLFGYVSKLFTEGKMPKMTSSERQWSC